MKPIKHAVSVVITNDEGQTLFALRAPHKESYPLSWSLPSHFVKDGENFETTIIRIGEHKLGVVLEPVSLLNEGQVDRGDFVLFMHDYAVNVIEGNPSINSDDYIELKWERPDKQFKLMKTMGECCRVYKEYLETQNKR